MLRFTLRLAVVSLLLSASALAREPALEGVLETVRANAARGAKSIVIMDLDDTVVDTHVRKYLAYRRATEELCGKASATIATPTSDDCERALGLAMHDIYRSENGYSASELMAKLGIRDPAFTKRLYQLRRRNEDRPELFRFDTLMPGASEFVRALKRAGGLVYFVSSRGADKHSESSAEQLVRHGLMTEAERSFVVLRRAGQSSLEFKRESARRLKETSARDGTPVVALFENEPGNLAAWIAEFPAAKAFFVTGSFATPAPIPPTAVSIATYR